MNETDTKGNKAGFTLTEVVVSSFILLMAVTVALSGYLFSLKNTHQSDIQSELDSDVQLAIERLKQDMRLSSMSLVRYYPAKPPYTAISFPIAYDTDGDGMLQREDRKIIWNDTVIYHIREGTPNELVRTVFSPRNNKLDGKERFDQLEYVVKNGGNAKATSRTIFANLLNWELNPRVGRFNGYDTIHTLEEDVFLGYALLDDGDHEITFEAVEAGQGRGFKLGIHQLMASAASTAREGKDLKPINQEKASATIVQALEGDGNYELYYPATEAGSKFSVMIHSDKWVETNFENPDKTENVQIKFNEPNFPEDIYVRLSGMEPAWEAKYQTGSAKYGTPGIELKGTAVRLLQKGDSILNGGFIGTEGERSRLVFRASNSQALSIGNVYFGESASDNTIYMGYKSAPVQLGLLSNLGNKSAAITIPAGHSVTSTWADVVINPTNNYLVSYTIANNPAEDSPAAWPDYNAASNAASARLAFLDGGASYSAASLSAETGNWDNLSDTNGLKILSPKYCIGLEEIQVCYSPTGSFSSRIVDTTLEPPSLEGFSENSITPYGTSLQFKVRTGNNSDLSDADDWADVPTSLQIKASNKRYVQFQALFKSDNAMLKTPVLKDVTVNWAGQTRLVNIGGAFSKGPDHGVFEVSVDGEKLTSALVVDMEIYKEIRTMNNAMRRISSSQKVEISPRNTGF